jgi:non-canonical purine NTP pyrophosphatase (RdgB/HAM1 family)
MAKKARTARTRKGGDRRKTDRRRIARIGGAAKRGAKREPLLVATTNPDKLKEIIAILGDLPVDVKTLKDFPGMNTAEESGATFAENAREKARHYAKATGLLTVAEDSGFEVDALNCEPGVYSARYLRPDATYPERFEAIYRALGEKAGKKVSQTRAARFVCALALASGRDILFETKGVVRSDLLLPALWQDVRRDLRGAEEGRQPPRRGDPGAEVAPRTEPVAG